MVAPSALRTQDGATAATGESGNLRTGGRVGGTRTGVAEGCARWMTITLRRLLSACALALLAASTHAAVADADATSDTLYFTITLGAPVYSMGFHYDGAGHVTLDPSHLITDLGHQGDGLA